jgi:hypothetical protein
MPLSAKAQAERRARLKRLAEPKKIRRARCANCDKPFPKTKPNRKFCKKECKREYEQNGGTAFGPLKTRLEKLVRQITGVLELRHTFLEKRVTKVEAALMLSAPVQSPSQPSPSAQAKDQPSGRR